jgi:hypothetical protein
MSMHVGGNHDHGVDETHKHRRTDGVAQFNLSIDNDGRIEEFMRDRTGRFSEVAAVVEAVGSIKATLSRGGVKNDLKDSSGDEMMSDRAGRLSGDVVIAAVATCKTVPDSGVFLPGAEGARHLAELAAASRVSIILRTKAACVCVRIDGIPPGVACVPLTVAM